MIKVSIIIPVYNVEKYLRRCLKSVVRQTFEEYEIICVNDCSPDNSQNIIDEYVKKYPKLIKSFINEKNKGLGKTREVGINNSLGQYVMFVDSDDYVTHDYVETYYNAIKKGNLDVVIGGYTRDCEGKLKKHFAKHSVWSIATYPIACAKMYKKDFLLENKIKFSEIRCGEDIYFSMSLYCANPNYEVIDYCGYHYYYNKESITGSMNYEKNHEKFIVSIFNEFMGNQDIYDLEKEKRTVIEYVYIANMVNALITYGHGGGIRRMKEKYEYWIKDMKKRFPQYRKNPYVGILKPKGQTWKIKLGVGLIGDLEKIHCAKPLLYIISLV
mgnify:FL=1